MESGGTKREACMNPLQRALIEKAGHDHGFEYTQSIDAESVKLASARHRAQVCITPVENQFTLSFALQASALLYIELQRSFPGLEHTDTGLLAPDQNALARLLRRAAELAHALPNQAAQDFDATLKQELEKLPAELKNTEVERLVRQRVGQQAFRSAMLDYWGGACAVTGIAISEVLRASHAKPWAECVSDVERLDVFNGFLLSANLDALFDRFMISFSDAGELLVAPDIDDNTRSLLGLDESFRLRWVAPEHLPYLQFHRDQSGL
ncbi:MAG: HNH endonuclease [Pseudohongiellaceae bacterium]